MSCLRRITWGAIALCFVFSVFSGLPRGGHVPGEIHAFDRLAAVPGLSENYWQMVKACESPRSVWHIWDNCAGWRR